MGLMDYDDEASHLAADAVFGSCWRPGCPNAEEPPPSLGRLDGGLESGRVSGPGTDGA